MNMNKKNTINEARRPANKQVGQHLFKGLRYDSNGNPLYTCDTLSNEEAQAMGWRFSPKYGLYGQLSDPTMFYESKKRSIKLKESDLKRVISESVKKVLNEEEINGLQWETIEHIRKLCAIESMAHRIRAGFSDYLYGGMTYDGGYFNGLQDNKLSPYMQKLMDVAVHIEHIAQERLEEYDEEIVRKVIKMTDPDALQGYL